MTLQVISPVSEVTIMTASPEAILDSQRQRIWAALDASTYARLKSLTPAARHLSLTARALVFLLVERSASNNRAIAGLSMRTNEYGQMLIFDQETFFAHASISHTEGQVAAALSFLGTVGIDIESERRPGQHVSVANRVFPVSVGAALSRASPSDVVAQFFIEWTIRESLVKACGLRNILALKSCSFQKNKEGGHAKYFQAVVPIASEPGPWDDLAYLGTVKMPPEWRTSVAVLRRGPKVNP